MKQFFREPFVHFVLLGAMLFAGHSLWQSHVTKSDRIILVSPAEMERQAQIFASENQRQPSETDLEGLLFAHIEEQALVREAKRLGLDEDDTIIRRRLAQKMRFMIDDVAVPELPKRAQLEAWFDDNTQRFTQPETRSFEHIYLSPKNRSDTVEAEGAALLAAGISDNWEAQGDAFMNGRRFADLSQSEVKRHFGTVFANAVFKLPDGPDWQGPLNSAFGVHIVRLTHINPETLPDFKTIQARVETLWLQDAKDAKNTEALKALIEKYRVEVSE